MESEEKIKVVLVDDHRSARQAYSSVIEDEENMEVVGQAGNGQELMELLESNLILPDIVILDIEMPVMGGLDALKIIIERFKSVKVIMLSMLDGEGFITEVLLMGASAYLVKNCELEDIIRTVNKVYDEGYHFSKSISHSVVSVLMQEKKTSTILEDLLSDREIEILKIICQGKTNKEIASLLFISLNTVKHHRKSINKKMKEKTGVPLIKYAIRNGITGFDDSNFSTK